MPKASTATTVYPPNFGKVRKVCIYKPHVTNHSLVLTRALVGIYYMSRCGGFVNGERRMDLDAISGAHGEFHLPSNTIKGNLRECAKFWKNCVLLDTVTNGYPLLMDPTVYT